jgi:Patatin-like phospholipase
MGAMDNRQEWPQTFMAELADLKQRGVAAQRTEDGLVGVAFSGGGIRSATFGLGVLESLKRFGLLKQVHYLSTVSGGGYIGAWLSANCKRAAERQIDWLDPKTDWDESVAHLRRYSNYLSPEVGFFSADTWSMFTIWIRNALLIQLTVILALASVLLLPRFLVVGFQYWPDTGDWRWTSVVLFILGVVGIAGNQRRVSSQRQVRFLQAQSWPIGLGLAAGLLLVARYYGSHIVHFDPFHGGLVDYRAAAPIALLLVGTGFCLQPCAVKLVAMLQRGPDAPTQINYSQGWVQIAVVAPMMVTCYLIGAILWGETTRGGALSTPTSFGGFFTTSWLYWPFPLAVVFFSIWLLSLCAVDTFKDWKAVAAGLLAPFVCVLTLHALLCAIMLLLHRWQSEPTGLLKAVVWAPALVLFAFSLTIIMLIGMMGRQSTDGVREWWSRLGAWLSIYGCAWMIVVVVALFGPAWVRTLVSLHPWKSVSTAGGWVALIVAGLFAGRSASTGSDSAESQTDMILEVVAEIAPFAFIAGLLVAVATGLDFIIGLNSDGQVWPGVSGLTDPLNLLRVPAVTLGFCLAALSIMASRVDINEFSLNAFYRNRLVRCYLGATRFGERTPQNFTGFDDDDDLALATLAGANSSKPSNGPFHIVNCALNLGGSSDLALHTRHGASFTLSPLHCGSNYRSRTQAGASQELGYIPTLHYGGLYGAPTLGQAMSVSGAAASPNMGYHTSPVVAFLLTVFNVRLGWWFPNPMTTKRNGTTRPSPGFTLPYLFAELFGAATDKSGFLMISDGGHFENLGVYELIKRKCRVIIVSDAECDPALTFEGLGTLIRVCEVDFGTKITIDVEAIRVGRGTTWSSSRCAVGTILYPDETSGTLIYLKASMTGHEDTAILQYKASSPEFPHESTSDQFYGEDQFESYRQLGQEVARRTFSTVIDENDQGGADDIVLLAARLLDTCAPSLARIGRFTEHSERLMKLWEQLGANPSLRGMDGSIAGESWPKDPSWSDRSEFYICSEMIQLMENVYLDLSLEETWDHPDNTGWRVMFTTWARSTPIKNTWRLTRGMFGRRFQYFCQRRLGLTVDEAGPRA